MNSPKMAGKSHNASVQITNLRGLHARAAAKFVQTAEQFSCAVQVRHKDQTVDGRSMLELLMLAAIPGSTIEILCDGADAPTALQELTTLVSHKFGEE